MATRDRRDPQNLSRREPGASSISRDPYSSSSNWSIDPTTQFRRLVDQMDRWFESIAGRGSNRPSTFGQPMNVWAPEMETFLRDDKFVVRMDIPGVTKDDVNVEVNDDSLVIHGERQQVHEEDRDGYYRSERSYGRFYRDVPLPEGAQPETAHASYRDGVLEVSITVPPRQVTRPRRVEISGASTGTEGTSPLIKDRTTSVSTERAVAHDREPWTPNTR